jgi:hypothetical protein
MLATWNKIPVKGICMPILNANALLKAARTCSQLS